MRNTSIAILSVVLAAAIVAVIVLYQRYRNTQDTLLVNEEKVAELNETVRLLRKETSGLHDKLTKSTERLRELEGMKARITELQRAIAEKEHLLPQFEQALSTLKRDLEEERETNASLEVELASRDASLAELQANLEGLQSYIWYLEEGIAQGHTEVEGLNRELTALERDKATLEDKLNQLRSTYEALVSELRDSIEEKTLTIKELQAHIRYLEGEASKRHTEIETLHRELTALEAQKSAWKRDMVQLQSTCEANLTKRHEELEGAKTRISELGHTIAMRDRTLSEYEGSIHTLQNDLGQERKIKESLEAELASKASLVTELQAQLKGAHSRIRSLEGTLTKTHHELEGLEGKLATLRGEKELATEKIDQLRSTYETLITDLKEQIEHQEVTIERFEEKISLTFVDRILFDFGKATITAEGEEILQRVGETLKTVKRKKIRVIGHTDDRPIHPDYHYKFPSNWELSSARASAVVRYFQHGTGFDPRNLEAVGRSFYGPVASNETPEGRAQNRRVEIIIAPQFE